MNRLLWASACSHRGPFGRTFHLKVQQFPNRHVLLPYEVELDHLQHDGSDLILDDLKDNEYIQ
jgi:hypothetical protein